MGLDYSGYDEYSKNYIYNFDDAAESEDVLIGVRIKGCDHSVLVTDYQYNSFHSFSDEGYSQSDYNFYLPQIRVLLFVPNRQVVNWSKGYSLIFCR